jgi:hypothetical protein
MIMLAIQPEEVQEHIPKFLEKINMDILVVGNMRENVCIGPSNSSNKYLYSI